MALARSVSEMDRRLQRSEVDLSATKESLVERTGQVDSLSQTVEFQQIKLNSLDLSLKLKETEVNTLARQLREQEQLIRRLEQKNRALEGGSDAGGSDSSAEPAVAQEQPLRPPRVEPLPLEGRALVGAPPVLAPMPAPGADPSRRRNDAALPSWLLNPSQSTPRGSSPRLRHLHTPAYSPRFGGGDDAGGGGGE